MTWAVIVAVLWWAIGYAGFVFWWTMEFDLGIGEAALGLLIAIPGPLVWLVGYFIHSPRRSGVALVRRR